MTRIPAFLALAGALSLSACAGASSPRAVATPAPAAGGAGAATSGNPATAAAPAHSDPRVGLRPGLFDAGEAAWNLRLVSTSPPPEAFLGATNSDLAFKDQYAIQGNYRGFIIWDLSDLGAPRVAREFVCPASQSDVSVFGNLLFVSGEGMEGRLDCSDEGVNAAVSADRLRGIRIFDISNILEPRYIANVQTCRGSHTHTVLADPDDTENVYIYVSGSAPVRPAEELPGCSGRAPGEDPESALFRIEVIRVPLADPAAAAIVSSPRIFEGLKAPPMHGPAPADLREIEAARARGAFTVEIPAIGETMILPDQMAAGILAQIVQARGGTGAPTAADSTALRERLPLMVQGMMGEGVDPDAGPTQCHDITVYPQLGLAGGACEGYGLLLDISDPVNPVRVDAVADENFAYWHSATFNNDGTAILFTDEWGGGGGPKCRDDDPREWGANALFSIVDGKMVFRSYYKLPAPQSSLENCVAHNGSLVPVPGRDIKVQAWYQGGISIFDWTDPTNPFEIAFHDRGPVNPERMVSGGPWSVYWYNGAIVSSEIARGLDVFDLAPSEFLTANEIAAAKTARLTELNVQGQPRYSWAPSFAVAAAYLDQLERSRGLDAARLAAVRAALARAEGATGTERRPTLAALAGELEREAGTSADARRVRLLAEVVGALAGE